MIYRREIDGLRAVAVIPVILFHAGFTVFSGGFVGVDVFFVISGYLITTILIEDLANGRFSILRFYERRARRIIPALSLVMLCSVPLAWMWMLPSELKNFSKSILAVVFFVSNILFWFQSGYFAPSAEIKPLLHTWSLAVEEQYYLIFPVFLFLIWKRGSDRAFWVTCLIAVLSFMASEWGWRYKPSANFYFAGTRAWELLAGSICALWLAERKPQARNVPSFIGLTLIVFAILFYDDTTPAPSAYLLVPVLGAALIILFGRAGTWVARLLGTRGFVGIGLISYSAYLWHQPSFAFARIRIIPVPSAMLMSALAILSLVLAYLTWRYVERPFRHGPASVIRGQRPVFVASAAIAAAFVVIGSAGYLGEGFSSRAKDSMRLESVESDLSGNHGLEGCPEGDIASPKCRLTDHPKVLLWGDSFAMHLAQGLVASDPRVALRQSTMSACSPIIGIAPIKGEGHGANWARQCLAFNDRVLDSIRSQGIEMVILSSPFSIANGGEFVDRAGSFHSFEDIELIKASLLDTADRVRRAGAKLLIVSPTPASGHDNGFCAVRSQFFQIRSEICNFKEDRSLKSLLVLKELEGEVPVYWLSHEICPGEVCRVQMDGVLIYRDDGHLSKKGSAHLGRKHHWTERFEALAR